MLVQSLDVINSIQYLLGLQILKLSIKLMCASDCLCYVFATVLTLLCRSSPPRLVVDKPDLDSSLAKLLRSDSSSRRNFAQNSSSNTSHSPFSHKKGNVCSVYDGIF